MFSRADLSSLAKLLEPELCKSCQRPRPNGFPIKTRHNNCTGCNGLGRVLNPEQREFITALKRAMDAYE